MSTALATSDDVRKFLNIAAGVDEVLLTALVAAASAFAHSVMERDNITVSSYSEKISGRGNTTLVPRHDPIVDVTSLVIDNVDIPRSTAYNVPGYCFDEFGIYLRGYRFTRGVKNVELTYTAGYESVPEDVKQAVVEITAEKYQRRLRMGVSSKTIGTEVISYTSTDLSANNKTILANYRSRFYAQ